MEKIKLQDIWNAKDVFAFILRLDVPAKCGYKAFKLHEALRGELIAIEAKRKNLVEKYGVKDDKGNASVPADKQGEFFKEFNDMLTLELDHELPRVKIPDDAKWSGDECPFIAVPSVDDEGKQTVRKVSIPMPAFFSVMEKFVEFIE